MESSRIVAFQTVPHNDMEHDSGKLYDRATKQPPHKEIKPRGRN